MASGFFLGGMAQGMQNADEMALKRDTLGQDLSLKTRALDIQQKAQEHATARDIYAQVDAQIATNMELISQSVQGMKDGGKSDVEIAQKTAPLIEGVQSLAKRAGRDPSVYPAQLALMLAKPPTPQKLQVIGEDVLNKQYGYPNPYQKTATPVTINAADVPTGVKMPPGQNITSGQVTGIEVTDAPISGYAPSKNAVVGKLIETGVMTKESIDLMAEKWLLEGDKALGGLSRSKLGVASRLAIQQRGAEMAQQRQLQAGDLTGRSAQTRSDANALSKLVVMKHSIEQFENTAIKNGDILVDLAKKVDKTGVPLIEKWVRLGRKEIAGDTDVSTFNLQMTTWRAEVAKILTNPNITGVLTDEARREVAAGISDGASYPQVKAAHELMKGDFKRRSEAIDQQISSIRESFKAGFGKTPTPVQQPASQPAPTVTDWRTYFGNR